MFRDYDYHLPVLYTEVLETLLIKPKGIYVDCTAGGGGHSLGILQQLSSAGVLISIDQDPEALKATKLKLESLNQNNAQFILVKNQFSHLREILNDLNIDKVDGVLADLGVSSHQIDTADRGFSFQKDGNLDMRMDPANSINAADIINNSSAEELNYIFRMYGEEKYARKIVAAIITERKTKLFRSTFELVDLIKKVVPAKSKREKHPAKRVFQALRIAVNQELKELEDLLNTLPQCVNSGGRIDLISFHSLEDRLIKHKFQEWENPCTCPDDFPVCVCGNVPLGKIISRKGITPSDREIAENSRARSARLRVFEMI
ncbi:MAG TPA: 16S rRNA (cytosine(1402)-N(4))-methyltransferase RsmH [Clostridiaceae bacterium]|nr:16S rRNA (cytosine(1402)-N(4))-methyltransferase RsmH [Clostridiaceae bacterium]